VTPDEQLRWEHDRLLTLLTDLARRNGGTLEWEQDRITNAPGLPFEFDWTDDGRITFRCHEDPS
jgi:hypothetical protein